MTYTFKLSRRLARLRAPMLFALLLTIFGCNSTDSLEPSSNQPGGANADPIGPSLGSATFAGGIPMGIIGLPTSDFGARYNGALQNNWPQFLLQELADIKASGGRVMLMFVGNEQYYKDGAGHFDFAKWKQRVDRFRGINFSSYVADGTIIGHYLIDEPNDPANWNGVPISPSMVDQMAQYSKQIWPDLVTIARTEPDYFPTSPRYLDAAWAQYLMRRGDVGSYIRKNVSDAQNRGLGLVVGLNVIKGGEPNGTPMTASEVQTLGTALLSTSYPCAFLSWHYEAGYLTGSAMGSAMDALRRLAQNRSTRSCGGGSQDPLPPPPEPTPTPEPSPTPVAGSTLPFGLFQTPMDEYSSRWTGSLYRAEPTDIVDRLGRAQNVGMKVVVALAWPDRVKNSDGTFSLTKWKAQVDRFRTVGIGSYVTGKTLQAHSLVDQPTCASCWGGRAISWATIEEMARYSKSIWPGLPTVARVAPTALAAADFRWNYLDAGWAQYDTRQGDLKTYLAKQVSVAKLEGLGLIVGLNLLDASGPSTNPMTAAQIKQFGTILAREPAACAMVGWRHNTTFLSQSGVRTALDSVAKVAKSRAAASCVVS